MCTRCAGLYPALALGCGAGLAGAEVSGWAGKALSLGAPAVGAAGWAAEQAGLTVPRWVRLASGALLGLGLGWVLSLHLRSPWTTELMELAATLGLIALIGLTLRASRRPDDLPLIEPLNQPGFEGSDQPGFEGSGKKSDSATENEVDPRAS